MISEKDKLNLIHKIANDCLEYPPGTESAEGYLSEALNVILIISEYTEEEDGNAR